jgi:hypothetical protein
LGWCEAQLKIGDDLLRSLEHRLVGPGTTHDAQRTGFGLALGPRQTCGPIAAHYIGGEYLARAHVGDKRVPLPLEPIDRARAKRAFDILNRAILSERAWQFSPTLLRQLVYTEWVTDFQQARWQYAPPLRHDEPISSAAGDMQAQLLGWMFQPTLLARLDDLSLKYPAGATMSLSDLFDWTRAAVFDDLTGKKAGAGAAIHRSLQQWYVRKLAEMWLSSASGTPYDARSLARAHLVKVRADVAAAAKDPKLDELTRAHLEALRSVVDSALEARTVVPVR